jgi:hypothetical protein
MVQLVHCPIKRGPINKPGYAIEMSLGVERDKSNSAMKPKGWALKLIVGA